MMAANGAWTWALALSLALLPACLQTGNTGVGTETSGPAGVPREGEPPWCEWHYTENPEGRCVGLKKEPWCVWIRVIPKYRDALDFCQQRLGAGAQHFTWENLAGQEIQNSAGPREDNYRNPRENGRPIFAVVFNRTGKALYQEWPVRVGEAQPFSFVLPQDPPFVVLVRDVAVSSEMKGTLAPGNWIGTNRIGPLYYGDYEKNATVFRHLEGEIRIPVGQTEASTTLELPLGLIYVNSGVGEARAGHSRGNFTIYDPLGRLNLAYDNTGLTGSDIFVWGFPPIEGSWRFQLRLPQPALQETVYWVFIEFQAMDLPVFAPLGFDWAKNK